MQAQSLIQFSLDNVVVDKRVKFSYSEYII